MFSSARLVGWSDGWIMEYCMGKGVHACIEVNVCAQFCVSININEQLERTHEDGGIISFVAGRCHWLERRKSLIRFERPVSHSLILFTFNSFNTFPSTHLFGARMRENRRSRHYLQNRIVLIF